MLSEDFSPNGKHNRSQTIVRVASPAQAMTPVAAVTIAALPTARRSERGMFARAELEVNLRGYSGVEVRENRLTVVAD